MLVLSRKKQESLVVASPDGADCLARITVIDVRNGRVTLGIEAASDIPVHRMEIWERVQRGGGASPTDRPAVTPPVAEPKNRQKVA